MIGVHKIKQNKLRKAVACHADLLLWGRLYAKLEVKPNQSSRVALDILFLNTPGDFNVRKTAGTFFSF